MFEKEYEQLHGYLVEMISNGVQLILAGHLFDWNDTKIPELLTSIKEKKEKSTVPELSPGDRLKHKVSGQEMWVISTDGETVFLNPGVPTIKYPLNSILNEFLIVKKSHNN